MSAAAPDSAASGALATAALHDPSPHEVARAVGVPSAIPADVSQAVVHAQSALDPWMPLLLIVLLAIAGVLLARHWRRTRAQARARAGLCVQRPGLGAARVPAPRIPAPLAAGAVMTLAAAFATLAGALHGERSGAIARFDAGAAAWAAAIDSPALRWLAMRLGDWGDVLPLAVLTVIVGVWLLRRREWVLAAGWLLGVVTNSVGVRVLKNAIARARPADMPDVLTSGFSFPSGHAAGAVMVFGLLAWVLRDQLPPGAWRTALVTACVALMAAIPVSRVVLGVHYASDVLGGVLWGAMLLLTTAALIGHARRW